MAAGDENRKLLCNCGKLLAAFTRQGLELYCRKETVTVPYGIADLRQAIAFVEQGRAAGTPPRREPRI